MDYRGAGKTFKTAATLAIALGLLTQGGLARADTGDEAVSNPEPLTGSSVAAVPDTAPTAAAPLAAGITSASDEATIYTLVNQARIAACAPILKRNGAMDRVARNWSHKMGDTSTFDHNPNYSTQIPAGWNSAGENVAMGYGTGENMFNGWMGSPGHRANILAPGYTDIGIGYVRGATLGYGTYGTQVIAGYPSNQAGKFLDVRPWTKFFTEIDWMGTSGLSTGVKVPTCAGEATYQPKERTSREAMAAFLYRMEGVSYQGPRDSPFLDVRQGDKFYNQIAWMHKMGYSTGVQQPQGKPKYDPKAAVSREAMAAFMYRVSEANYAGAKSSPFADVVPGQKFYREITWMHNAGLSTGTKQPKGKPEYASKSQVTREAMAAFIYRLKN